jgi:hypothetical protein
MTLDDLIQRDGSECVWCGRAPWRRDLTAEHLMPRSRGGRTSPENLTVACRSCNKRRGTKPVVAFARAQLDAGAPVRTEVLQLTLARLADSDRRDLAGYGQRQHALLQRLVAEMAPRHHGAAVRVS